MPLFARHSESDDAVYRIQLHGDNVENLGSYFEIPVADRERAISFYQSAFGVEFFRDTIHENEMAFFPLHKGRSGITGALAKGQVHKPSLNGTLIYLNTEDIDASLKKIMELGGEVLFPKTEVASYGWVAEFKD
jgi:predicted enzyme related to lactoylglutathione lyase